MTAASPQSNTPAEADQSPLDDWGKDGGLGQGHDHGHHRDDGEARSAHGMSASLAAAFRVTGRFDAQSSAPPTPFERLLPALLEAMAWTGEVRHIVEALPHVDPIATLTEFEDTLFRLGYSLIEDHVDLSDCDSRKFPLLYTDAGVLVLAVGPGPGGRIQTVRAAPEGDGTEEIAVAPPARDVKALIITSERDEPTTASSKGSWFVEVIGSVRGEMIGVLALTLATTLFAVATPLYSMFVYNAVIPSKAYDTLAFGVGLILLAFATDDYLRRLRGRLITRIAVTLHLKISKSSLEKVLSLPVGRLQNVSISSQITQIKRFDNIVTLFQGQAVSALLDLPFTLVLLAVIAAIAGPLALIPAALVVAFAVLAVVHAPFAAYAEARQSVARRDASDLIRETVLSADAIRGSGAAEIWTERLGRALDAEVDAASRNDLGQQGIGYVAQAMVSLAAAGMLVAGALSVMDGTLSVGALVAVMMLVWRVYAPIQASLASLNQLRGAREDIRMIDNLMRLSEENAGGSAAKIYRRFRGEMRVESLSLRYPRMTELALRGVSLTVAPGERVGLVGPSGAGKTTLMRAALGFYEPLAGGVALDGLPLSQLDAGEVRSAMTYAPSTPQFFYGTVAQNIRLARNDVTDDEILEQLERLHLSLTPEAFPQGLGTRLTAARRAALGPGPLQKLSLARAFLARRPVMLLDDPFIALGPQSQKAALDELDALRPNAAVIVSGNHRELTESCDRLVVLNRGQVVAAGPTSTVLSELGAAPAPKR